MTPNDAVETLQAWVAFAAASPWGPPVGAALLAALLGGAALRALSRPASAAAPAAGDPDRAALETQAARLRFELAETKAALASLETERRG